MVIVTKMITVISVIVVLLNVVKMPITEFFSMAI